MRGHESNQDIDLSEVADEPAEDSVDAERDAVGRDQPDVGGTVPPDQSQSAHDS